ncbi:MAG TPA: glutamate--cysteine ligase [Dermatophilaceae bacterium]|nr:glutamate--cysteine ligase [Dermatophilaceae bacterium]
MLRSVGVEEELLLVDPGTGRALDRAPAVLRAASGTDRLAGDGPGGTVEHELQRQQIEIDTTPHTSLHELAAELREQRRRLAELAASQGVAPAALATSPLPVVPATTADDRYEDMVRLYGPTGWEQLVCGTHVHVWVDGDEEAVAVLDRIRPWLATMSALSANSPYWQGRDTTYESFRSHVWSRWPTAGPPEAFGTPQRYRAAVAALVATGAVLDDGMIYWEARLGRGYPTVEIRVGDVCTDAGVPVLLAALCRALVDTAADQWRAGGPAPDAPTELLRLASWRAARSGLTGELVHPLRFVPAAAWQVVDLLREHVDAALVRNGDAGLVDSQLHRIRADGTGSARQRSVFAAAGELAAVVRDAVQRTVST